MNRETAGEFFSLMNDVEKLVYKMAEVGVMSKSEYCMLNMIMLCSERCDVVTTSMVSERLGISKSAVSQLINILEEKGYIQRNVNKTDRRSVCITITKRGNEMLAKQKSSMFCVVEKILDRLGEGESEKFLSTARKLVSIFGEINQGECLTEGGYHVENS